MNKKKVSLDTIAEKLGVSKVSVYKALNGHSDISDELKERVLSTAAELNYRQIDPLTKLCRTFYYIISEKFCSSSEQFYFGIYSALQEKLHSVGCTLEMYRVGRTMDVERFISSVSRYKKAQFGVFIAGQLPIEILKSFERHKLPTVCFDYYTEKADLNYIYFDNYRAGYYLTNYLISQGHSDLCFFVDTDNYTTNADKYFGFRKSLLENGIAYSRRMHVNVDLQRNNSFLNITLPDPLPTCCVFDSDISASIFSIAMSAKGVKIPEDVSIASFDNTDMSAEVTPPLTSIGVDKSEIVECCYAAMLSALTHPEKKNYYTIAPKLHVRSSVKKL